MVGFLPPDTATSSAILLSRDLWRARLLKLLEWSVFWQETRFPETGANLIKILNMFDVQQLKIKILMFEKKKESRSRLRWKVITLPTDYVYRGKIWLFLLKINNFAENKSLGNEEKRSAKIKFLQFLVGELLQSRLTKQKKGKFLFFIG